MSIWLAGLYLLLQFTVLGKVFKMLFIQICSIRGACANKDGRGVFGSCRYMLLSVSFSFKFNEMSASIRKVGLFEKGCKFPSGITRLRKASSEHCISVEGVVVDFCL